jgi:hypothetical protein
MNQVPLFMSIRLQLLIGHRDLNLTAGHRYSFLDVDLQFAFSTLFSRIVFSGTATLQNHQPRMRIPDCMVCSLAPVSIHEKKFLVECGNQMQFLRLREEAKEEIAEVHRENEGLKK